MFNCYYKAVDGATTTVYDATKQSVIDFVRKWTGQDFNFHQSHYVSNDGVGVVDVEFYKLPPVYIFTVAHEFINRTVEEINNQSWELEDMDMKLAARTHENLGEIYDPEDPSTELYGIISELADFFMTIKLRYKR